MSDVRYWQVPGRVNVIGEHLDYNGGPVLPIAIDRTMFIKIRARDDATIRLWSTFAGERHHTEFGVDAAPGEVEPWARYVAGSIWAYRDNGGRCHGADIVIESQIPGGAGLSSSAAVTCGVVAAVADLDDPGALDRLSIARLGRRAETDYVGVPVGFMDQLAVTCAQDGKALLINTGSINTGSIDTGSINTGSIDSESASSGMEHVNAEWERDGLELMVVATGVPHALTDGSYAQRRQECESAARELGLDYLSHAGPDAVLRLSDSTLIARTRHVITETARVRGAVKALSAAEWPELGAKLTASHVSLRDDFQVSSAELDVTVDAALEAGALGARMTGGGFGGSAIALVPRDTRDTVAERVTAAFQDAGWAAPDIFTVRPAAGLHRSNA